MEEIHIKGDKSLRSTKLRRDAVAIMEAGLNAIRTEPVVERSVKLKGNKLTIGDHNWDLAKYKNIYVVGIGKASADAGAALEKILGARLTDGIVIDVKSRPLKRLKSIVGTHPMPSMTNMRATGEIIGLLKHLESQDLLICIISGGGSALLCWPYEIKCGALAMITHQLMHAGANIHELNTVRKHLSEIQGGQLARLAYPATVIGLIFSDVPGDDIDVVASGPTVLDLSTIEDARRVLDKYNVLKMCRLPDCELIETPKDPLFFRKVTNIILANNQASLMAMEKAAVKLNYKARIYSDQLTGEAREVGAMLALLPESGEVVIAGGETTVTVKGKGSGGRNRELVLGALGSIDEDVLLMSVASDGVDNGSKAGAIADSGIKKQAAKLRLNAQKYLEKNDSGTFFNKTGGCLFTGITGANISDLMLAIRK